MAHCISPCAFIGEFDQELGTTIIYAFEYYRLHHVYDCSQHPQRCTYPLCVAHFVRGTCCVTSNIISGVVQEREKRMLIHIASRLLNSHNSSQELIVMEDDEFFAIAGITFTLPDILARGEVRHFCIFVLHPSFNVLMSQWSIINIYLRCLILQWETIASSRRLYECNHVGNIEERREAAHRGALRHLLELVATNDHTSTNETNEFNTIKEKNEYDNISIINNNEQVSMNSMTYARIHGFFEYVMPIFFACTYRISSNIVGNALSRSFEPQISFYHKLLQTSSLNISSSEKVKQESQTETHSENNSHDTEILSELWNEIMWHVNTNVISSLREAEFSHLEKGDHFFMLCAKNVITQKSNRTNSVFVLTPNLHTNVNMRKPLMVWLSEFIYSSSHPLSSSWSESSSSGTLRQTSVLLDALLAGDQINIHSCDATCGAYFAIALAWFLPPSLRYTAVFAEREQYLYEARIVSYCSEFVSSHCSSHVTLQDDCAYSCKYSEPDWTHRKGSHNNDNSRTKCNSSNCNRCKGYWWWEQHKDDAHVYEVQMAEKELLTLDCPETCEHTIVHAVVHENALLHVFTHKEYLQRVNSNQHKRKLIKSSQAISNEHISSSLTNELICLLTQSITTTHTFKSIETEAVSHAEKESNATHTCETSISHAPNAICTKSQLQYLVAEARQLIYKYVMYGNMYLTLFCHQKVRHALQPIESCINNIKINRVQTHEERKRKQEQEQGHEKEKEHLAETTAHTSSLEQSTVMWRYLQNLLTNSTRQDKQSNSEISELPPRAKKDHNVLVFLGGGGAAST